MAALVCLWVLVELQCPHITQQQFSDLRHVHGLSSVDHGHLRCPKGNVWKRLVPQYFNHPKSNHGVIRWKTLAPFPHPMHPIRTAQHSLGAQGSAEVHQRGPVPWPHGRIQQFGHQRTEDHLRSEDGGVEGMTYWDCFGVFFLIIGRQFL